MSDEINELQTDLIELITRFSVIEKSIFETINEFNVLNIKNSITIENTGNDPIEDNISSLKVTEGKVSLITKASTDISNLSQVSLKDGYLIQKNNFFYLNDAKNNNIDNDNDFNIVTDKIMINHSNCLGDSNIAGTLIADSDINLKTNLKKLDNCLDNIKYITGYKYERIDLSDNNKIHIGVIAQDVEKCYPELVTEKMIKEKKTKGVNYNGLSPILIECIKELTIKMDNLEEKYNNIEKIIEQLIK